MPACRPSATSSSTQDSRASSKAPLPSKHSTQRLYARLSARSCGPTRSRSSASNGAVPWCAGCAVHQHVDPKAVGASLMFSVKLRLLRASKLAVAQNLAVHWRPAAVVTKHSVWCMPITLRASSVHAQKQDSADSARSAVQGRYLSTTVARSASSCSTASYRRRRRLIRQCASVLTATHQADCGKACSGSACSG